MASLVLLETEIVNANILRVSVGTTGPKGGDSGHGGRTVFALHDLAGTDMRVIPDNTGFTIELGGDAELETFIEALEFAVSILKSGYWDGGITSRAYETSR